MDLRIARDVFRRRSSRVTRIDPELLGADAYVVPEPAFVTGLRDWRRPAVTTLRHADVVDGDWLPL